MITVIIPTYNEANIIENLVRFLIKNGSGYIKEIIVSDAGSTDNTCELATKAGALAITGGHKGRAAQMNFAASQSSGDILYFVHADTFPPAGFAEDITGAIAAGYQCGRYQTKFISNDLLLKLNAFFTRFDLFFCYGGDQTFFISKELFNEIKGYDISKIIMEDFDITIRARKKGRYKIFNKKAMISARKYKLNSWIKVQKANYRAIQLYKKGVSTATISDIYKTMLRF